MRSSAEGPPRGRAPPKRSASAAAVAACAARVATALADARRGRFGDSDRDADRGLTPRGAAFATATHGEPGPGAAAGDAAALPRRRGPGFGSFRSGAGRDETWQSRRREGNAARGGAGASPSPSPPGRAFLRCRHPVGLAAAASRQIRTTTEPSGRVTGCGQCDAACVTTPSRPLACRSRGRDGMGPLRPRMDDVAGRCTFGDCVRLLVGLPVRQGETGAVRSLGMADRGLFTVSGKSAAGHQRGALPLKGAQNF